MKPKLSILDQYASMPLVLCCLVNQKICFSFIDFTVSYVPMTIEKPVATSEDLLLVDGIIRG